MLTMSTAFPWRLRMYRQAAGLTLADLSRKVAVSRQTLHNWERGKHAPSMQNLRVLAKVLHVTVSHLVGDIAFAEGLEETLHDTHTSA